MYKCRYFELHELVPPDIYESLAERGWELLDDRALITLDSLRDVFGRMTINNYEFGGDRRWSGFRTSDSPYYSPTSQHSFGRAFDCLFDEVAVDKVRNKILVDPDSFPHITGIENFEGMGWLHFDVRNLIKIKVFGKG